MIAAALALSLLPQAAFQGELAETLATAPDRVFQSTRRPQDIEICIADALSRVGNPSILRQGDNQIVIASFLSDGGGAVLATVTLRFASMPMIVELRVRGKAGGNGMREHVASCVS